MIHDPLTLNLPWTAIAVAFLLSLAGVWLGMLAAHRTGAVAKVQADRWHQTGVVPKLAGPGLLAGLIPAMPLDLWLVAATACAIGCLDDHRRFSAGTKAILLLIPAVLAAFATGLPWIAPAVWISANAWNLLDHADGIAGAAALAALLLGGGADGAAAAAAVAGFLVFNYPPARSFMGDGGSLLLGTVIVLLAAKNGGPVGVLAWCAIPLADSALVVASRLRRGVPPWKGDTDHSGHRLLRMGVPGRLLPVIYFAAAAALGLAVTRMAAIMLPAA